MGRGWIIFEEWGWYKKKFVWLNLSFVLVLYYIRWMYGNQRYQEGMPELVVLERKGTNPKSSRMVSDEPARSKVDEAKVSN